MIVGLLSWLFPEEDRPKNEKYPVNQFQMLTGYKPIFRDYYGRIYENALIRSAIESKARHISKLKVEFRGEAQQKVKNRLKFYPNEWMTWSQFLARCSTILDCTNNLFIVPVYNNKLEIVGLFPILPERVELVEDKKKTLWIRYTFANGQRGAIEFSKCAYMVKHQYENDFFGSNNTVLRPTLDLISVEEQAVKEAVTNSTTIRFIAQANNFVSPEDLALERQRFTEYNLKGDSTEMLLFPYQYKDIKQVDVKPYTLDSEMVEKVKDNVFDYFGTNEEIIQGKASNDKLDAYFNAQIEPFAIGMSEALSKMIYTDLERSYDNHVYVASNRLQYMTVSEKVNMAQQLSDRGILTINEIRELFNYDPIPNGDVAVIRGEYYTVNEKVGENNGTQEN